MEISPFFANEQPKSISFQVHPYLQLQAEQLRLLQQNIVQILQSLLFVNNL